MKTAEKDTSPKASAKKVKRFKTAKEAFQAKHNAVRELLKDVDLNQLRK